MWDILVVGGVVEEVLGVGIGQGVVAWGWGSKWGIGLVRSANWFVVVAGWMVMPSRVGVWWWVVKGDVDEQG